MSNNGAWGTAAAAVNALGNTGAASIQNSGTKKSQNRARAANMEFWNLQNVYNHPANQMKRLRDAGLNPNLIYGNSGNTGNAGSIAPAQAESFTMPNPFAGGVHALANAGLVSAQTDNLKQQGEVLAAEVFLKNAQTASEKERKFLLNSQTAKTKFEAVQSRLKAMQETELYQTSVDARKVALENMRQETFGRFYDNYFKSKTMADRVKRIAYEADLAKSTQSGQILSNTLKRLEINLNRLGLQKTDPVWARVLGQGAASADNSPGFKGGFFQGVRDSKWFNWWSNWWSNKN